MLKSRLCDYGDAYILVKWTISTAAQGGGNSNKRHKWLVFKKCAPFTDCMNEINNIKIDNAKVIDVTIYNLIEYSNV